MNPLRHIFWQPTPIGKLAKWQMLLSEFHIVCVAQKAVKGQALADLLAESPIDDELKPLRTFFPDEEVMAMEEDVVEPYSGWRLFFDGAVNYKGSGIGEVEATSHKSVTKKIVADFVKNNLICRFGVPESIITDNGANLNRNLIKDICEQFKITHMNSTAYRPQMNGAVEAANKNIKRILRKMVDNYENWHEQLPYALLGYIIKTRTSTGETPYLLIYGTKAVIPAEVEIPSLRIIQEAELKDAEWVRNRYEQLAMIEEERIVAVCHEQLYRERMSRAFSKRLLFYRTADTPPTGLLIAKAESKPIPVERDQKGHRANERKYKPDQEGHAKSGNRICIRPRGSQLVTISEGVPA
ncbi:uncharacterized protein LOC132613062 [Lycium barbarum]|uniref:uncharacterized protein LOC132613062 n=1 Tax=Lycium barbarum TaxID=112863 RepID=UPI00293EDF8E|nr:uncharacterized protein LOC132613062 [Lycium barbarum]